MLVLQLLRLQKSFKKKGLNITNKHEQRIIALTHLSFVTFDNLSFSENETTKDSTTRVETRKVTTASKGKSIST